MKDAKQTLCEIVNYISSTHHELSSTLEQIIFNKNLFDANLLLALNDSLLRKSKSQLRQDIFVLFELNFKKNGYFVEFGATNGIDLSNTFLLEKEFNWKGILVEPAKIWHSDLEKNRDVKIDKRCVWKDSGITLQFNQTNESEFSTIDCLSSSDHHAKKREHGEKYSVNTVSLLDLLKEYEAPKHIDYLSIDTEGSELDILESFDFNKYNIKVISCEHNYTPIREKLNTLLLKNGYIKKYEQFSQHDDWWVLK
jgi:FkbM family methyltransferase